MFCYQCEQTAKGRMRQIRGVRKLPDVAALQDLLVYVMMGLGQAATAARKAGIRDHEPMSSPARPCLRTLTNVDFDPTRFQILINRAAALRDGFCRSFAPRASPPIFRRSATIKPAATCGLIVQGEKVGIRSYPAPIPNPSLKHTLRVGLKGMAAYRGSCAVSGRRTSDLRVPPRGARRDRRKTEARRAAGAGDEMRPGESPHDGDPRRGQTPGAYGRPPVPRGCRGEKGKAILISGHDLRTSMTCSSRPGEGITIYTTARCSPPTAIRAEEDAHLYGHYGTAWQNQHKSSTEFPGRSDDDQLPSSGRRTPIRIGSSRGRVGWPG